MGRLAMSEEIPPLLFLSDPQRFMQLVMTEDFEQRLDGGLKLFDDIFICEILRYGIYNDVRMIPDLQQFYRYELMRVPPERRRQIYGHVAGMVENVSYVSASAFLPFIAEDHNAAIVATAVIDYVSLSPLIDEDPMSRPKEIVGLIGGGNAQKRRCRLRGLAAYRRPSRLQAYLAAS